MLLLLLLFSFTLFYCLREIFIFTQAHTQVLTQHGRACSAHIIVGRWLLLLLLIVCVCVGCGGRSVGSFAGSLCWIVQPAGNRHSECAIMFCCPFRFQFLFCCFHFYILFALFFPLRRVASEWNARRTQTHLRARTHTRSGISICSCTRTHAHITLICTYVCLCVCVCVCMWACTYISQRYVLHFNFIFMLFGLQRRFRIDHVAHVLVLPLIYMCVCMYLCMYMYFLCTFLAASSFSLLLLMLSLSSSSSSSQRVEIIRHGVDA